MRAARQSACVKQCHSSRRLIPLPLGSGPPSCCSHGRGSCGAQHAPEGGTFHMACRLTSRCMPQSVAQGAQLPYAPLQLLRPAREHCTVDAWPPIARKHPCDFVERKARGATERDQCQSVQHSRIVLTTQAMPAYGRNQASFLIETKRRSGDSRPLRDLSDIHSTQP